MCPSNQVEKMILSLPKISTPAWALGNMLSIYVRSWPTLVKLGILAATASSLCTSQWSHDHSLVHFKMSVNFLQGKMRGWLDLTSLSSVKSWQPPGQKLQMESAKHWHDTHAMKMLPPKGFWIKLRATQVLESMIILMLRCSIVARSQILSNFIKEILQTWARAIWGRQFCQWWFWHWHCVMIRSIPWYTLCNLSWMRPTEYLWFFKEIWQLWSTIEATTISVAAQNLPKYDNKLCA